jgi:hypothetical protein
MSFNLVNRISSSLVFDDFCRLAVGRLNDFRSERAEDLGDGYDVSKFHLLVCYDINRSEIERC